MGDTSAFGTHVRVSPKSSLIVAKMFMDPRPSGGTRAFLLLPPLLGARPSISSQTLCPHAGYFLSQSLHWLSALQSSNLPLIPFNKIYTTKTPNHLKESNSVSVRASTMVPNLQLPLAPNLSPPQRKLRTHWALHADPVLPPALSVFKDPPLLSIFC